MPNNTHHNTRTHGSVRAETARLTGPTYQIIRAKTKKKLETGGRSPGRAGRGGEAVKWVPPPNPSAIHTYTTTSSPTPPPRRARSGRESRVAVVVAVVGDGAQHHPGLRLRQAPRRPAGLPLRRPPPPPPPPLLPLAPLLQIHLRSVRMIDAPCFFFLFFL